MEIDNFKAVLDEKAFTAVDYTETFFRKNGVTEHRVILQTKGGCKMTYEADSLATIYDCLPEWAKKQ